MENQYHYFIVYKHRDGYGNMEITLPIKIKTLNNILDLQNMIIDKVREKDGDRLRDVCITNFQLFD